VGRRCLRARKALHPSFTAPAERRPSHARARGVRVARLSDDGPRPARGRLPAGAARGGARARLPVRAARRLGALAHGNARGHRCPPAGDAPRLWRLPRRAPRAPLRVPGRSDARAPDRREDRRDPRPRAGPRPRRLGAALAHVPVRHRRGRPALAPGRRRSGRPHRPGAPARLAARRGGLAHRERRHRAQPRAARAGRRWPGRVGPPYAALAAPTPEHLDPLFVVLGAALPGDRVRTLHEGFELGTLSLRSIVLSGSELGVDRPTPRR
jgi:hypothetical protein